MASKRGPGRPKLPKASLKGVTLRVRMSRAQRRALDEAAGAAGMTASEFMRFLLQRHLDEQRDHVGVRAGARDESERARRGRGSVIMAGQ